MSSAATSFNKAYLAAADWCQAPFSMWMHLKGGVIVKQNQRGQIQAIQEVE